MGPFRLERGARCELAVMGNPECRMGTIHDIIHNVALNRTTVIFRADDQHEELDCAKGPIFDKEESESKVRQEVPEPGNYYGGRNEARQGVMPSEQGSLNLNQRVVHVEQRLAMKEKIGEEIVALMDKLEAGMKEDYTARKELGSKIQEMRYEHAMRIRRGEENIRTLFDALSDCRNVLSEIAADVKKRTATPPQRRASDKKKKKRVNHRITR